MVYILSKLGFAGALTPDLRRKRKMQDSHWAVNYDCQNPLSIHLLPIQTKKEKWMLICCLMVVSELQKEVLRRLLRLQ